MNRVKLYIVIFSILSFLTPSFGNVSADSFIDTDEIKEYFELRDTIVMMNDEMKKIITDSVHNNFFGTDEAEKNLNGCMRFLEERIDEFSSKDTQMKYHYVKKLRNLFNESVRLHPIVMARFIGDSIKKINQDEISEDKYLAEPWHRPFFEPIDVRTLAAVPGNEANRTKSIDFASRGRTSAIKPVKLETPPVLPSTVVAAEPPAQTPKIDETLQKVADIIIEKPNVSKTAKEVFKDLNKKIEAKEEKEEKAKPELSVIKTQPEVASASRVITGPITGPIRPMAIMIENHRLARPQTGLNEANIVYEIPVEGGITRFMGIYNKIPGVVGPIRSCREYFVDRALEVSALYVHCGGSPKGYQYLASSHIFSIDEIKIGKGFFRDNTRKGPHNLYGKGREIFDSASENFPMLLKNKVKLLNYGVQESLGSKEAKTATIKYHGNYEVKIKYDNGSYLRYMNDELHVDRITKKPLSAYAIVIQEAAMKTVDKAGRQEISFIGNGIAWILEKGRLTNVTWHKNEADSATVFKDEKGIEYKFPENKQIWIQVVSPTQTPEIN
ncbi:MAG: DUF3048 domain-containing protein [Candidatus Riflebacteria bacterium]|nr:DUF3048 domain-containing protein [Candidatus Riflebacteria bacterium]